MKFSSLRYSRNGFAKDPIVVKLGADYWLYYSEFDAEKRLRVAIARARDLDDWEFVGLMPLVGEVERNGIGAPGAVVLDGAIHLFYQTYGNGTGDAICHAVSRDGLNFERNAGNPIFRPRGEWTCGRAIDADVLVHGDTLFLGCATRDPNFKVQKLVMATAPLDADFGPQSWTQRGEGSILEPQLNWEGECIEAPALLRRDGKFWMFYAGAYNASPQQIGLAVSDDGIDWRRTSDKPFLPNGAPGSWNADESGHPGVLRDEDRAHLFFQGTPDQGKTWIISRVEIEDHDWPLDYGVKTPRDTKVVGLVD